jgi:hypothetical protein
MKKYLFLFWMAGFASFGHAGAATGSDSSSLGQPSIFWHDGKWEIYTNDHWIPYADSKKVVAMNDQPYRIPIYRPEDNVPTNDAAYIYPGGWYGPGAFPVSRRHLKKKRESQTHEATVSNLGQPNIGIGRPTIGIGQPNGGIGQPNVEIGQPTIGIGQNNTAIGQTTIGIGQPSGTIGRRNVELGKPNNAIGQTTIGIGQQTPPLPPTTVGIGQPTIGIGKPTIGIGKPMNSTRPQPTPSHHNHDH